MKYILTFLNIVIRFTLFNLVCAVIVSMVFSIKTGVNFFFISEPILWFMAFSLMFPGLGYKGIEVDDDQSKVLLVKGRPLDLDLR